MLRFVVENLGQTASAQACYSQFILNNQTFAYIKSIVKRNARAPRERLERSRLVRPLHARVAEAGASFAFVVGFAGLAHLEQALALVVFLFLLVLRNARSSVAREAPGTIVCVICVIARTALDDSGGGFVVAGPVVGGPVGSGLVGGGLVGGGLAGAGPLCGGQSGHERDEGEERRCLVGLHVVCGKCYC